MLKSSIISGKEILWLWLCDEVETGVLDKATDMDRVGAIVIALNELSVGVAEEPRKDEYSSVKI